jgi:ParB-like chromosome segregation protein Spo0J
MAVLLPSRDVPGVEADGTRMRPVDATTSVTLDVEVADVEDLVEDPKNARRHSDRNIEAIARSLERFGQRRPIVVHRGTVIAGNGTLAAARKLGWDRLAVVRTPDEWTEDDARAFAIADNRTSDLASWDYDELVQSLGTLDDEALIEAAGYTQDEYDDLIAKLQEGAASEDDLTTGPRRTPSLDEYAERYADRATRLLVCEFPNATYVWLQDRLRDLRADLDVTNNADVIVRLVADRFGEPVGGPAGDGG